MVDRCHLHAAQAPGECVKTPTQHQGVPYTDFIRIAGAHLSAKSAKRGGQLQYGMAQYTEYFCQDSQSRTHR
jgi:hypothetical protein